MKEWGVDMSNTTRGGLLEPVDSPPARKVFLLQRKKGALGTGLGKTTGWIHRATLRKKSVNMMSGVEYVKVDDEGLHIKVHPKKKGGEVVEQVLDVDHVVVCAGQESITGFKEPLKAAGVPAFEIGGAEHGLWVGGVDCAFVLHAPAQPTCHPNNSGRARRQARHRPRHTACRRDRDGRSGGCVQSARPVLRRPGSQRPQMEWPELLLVSDRNVGGAPNTGNSYEARH